MQEYYLEEQLAGIANIEFYKLTQVSNFPIQLSDRNSGQLVFSADENGVIATVDEESFADDTKVKESSGGTLHEIALKYNILSRGADLEKVLDAYKNKPGIAVVKYHAGFSRIFGTNEEPLFMNFTNKNGSTISDKASVPVEIQGVTRNRPVYYSL